MVKIRPPRAAFSALQKQSCTRTQRSRNGVNRSYYCLILSRAALLHSGPHVWRLWIAANTSALGLAKRPNTKESGIPSVRSSTVYLENLASFFSAGFPPDRKTDSKSFSFRVTMGIWPNAWSKSLCYLTVTIDNRHKIL